MPSRKDKEELAATLDRFVGQLDPGLSVAMLSMGLASAGGIVPPFTRMLIATSDYEAHDYVDIAAQIVSPAYFVSKLEYNTFMSIIRGALGGSDEEHGKSDIASSTMFFAGMAEMYLLAQLFSNPEFMKGLMGAASSGVGLLKGVAATAL